MKQEDLDEQLAQALARLLVAHFRKMHDSAQPKTEPSKSVTPWLNAKQAAARAQVGAKVLYAEVRKGRLRASRIGGRKQLRFRAEWIDAWLDASVKP